ncbi:tonB-system energizer ExbB [Zestomonas carbonaria]|uniref:Biopolymer transport protein ExbB n=1 Tax=Zestomonas carbonaria TaxID=2762745 RepID=A0A7U7EJQ7_9GAMM|nr:tonB-system energizer ExbB [Pseudomonas carbonaria]CAD5106279.1 Tol-Pal system protein TolQ [Pseudomonas carbonaria]
MNANHSNAQPVRPSRASRGLAALFCSLLLVPTLASADEPVGAEAAAQTAPAASAPADPAAAPATPSAIDAAATDAASAPAVGENGEAAIDPAALAEAEQQEVVAAEQTLAHDLSPWGMYQGADIVVKAVMIGLVIASIITWTIWIAKGLELFNSRRRLLVELAGLKKARTLKEADEGTARQGCLSHQLVQEALEEVKLSANTREKEGIKERVSFRLERLVAASGRHMSKGTGPLATIGSTAPFVGLFGTVWGIMNSFIGIAKSQTTNLAVVAPGIAEALLATALGLVAAIPAVVIYNVFSRSITGYKAQVADCSAQVLLLLSRDLDHLPASDRNQQANVVKLG